jgi:hypothetical protein
LTFSHFVGIISPISMYKIFAFLCLVVTATSARAASDSLSVVIQGDSVSIWNTGIYENCAFQGIAAPEIRNTLITISEKDTSGLPPAYCMCYFSMCATMTGLPPGRYDVFVYRYYYSDTTFVGTLSFDYGGTAGTLVQSSYQSPCYHFESVKKGLSLLPEKFSLESFPNPFNPSATIRYSLPAGSFVTVKVYDVLGREVAVLANGQFPAGVYERLLNARELPSGVYFCTMTAGGERLITKKLVLAR